MKIMVNLPEAQAERETLARRASELHAEAIRGVLAGLRCPKVQKKAVLHAVFREKQGENGTFASFVNTR